MNNEFVCATQGCCNTVQIQGLTCTDCRYVAATHGPPSHQPAEWNEEYLAACFYTWYDRDNPNDIPF